jgi:hypothetical protein
MRTGYIGGLLVIGACLLIVVTAAIGAAGGQVSVQGAGPGSLTLTAALAMLAVGALLIGVGGSRPLNGRFARLGLVLSGIGLTATLSTASASASSMLVFVFLIGGLVAWIGVIITGLAVLATPGAPRRAGLTFGAGLLIAAAAGALNNVVGPTMAGPIALVGGAVVLAGIASIGLLGVRAGRAQTFVAGPGASGAD